MTMDDAADTLFASRRSPALVLFNPFHFLAGGAALALGLAVILLTGLLSRLSHSHFDGVLDFHSWPSTVVAPLSLHLAEGLIAWFLPSLLLYGAGKALSHGRARALDVFGTQALARAPHLLTALAALLPGYQRISERVGTAVLTGSWSLLTDEPAALAAFVFALLVVLLATIWMVALMYRGYVLSCNLKGARAIVSFIVALLLAEGLAVAANLALVNYLVAHKLINV
jgi:hypothetical protein